MINLFRIATPYFLALIFIFALSCSIGYLIFKVFLKNTKFKGFYANLFINALTGVSVLVTVISLYYTKGISVNLVVLLLGVFILFEFCISKKSKSHIDYYVAELNTIKHFNWNNLIGIFILVITVFLWQASVVFKLEGFPIHHIEKDSFFYAELSKCLVNRGQENTFASSNLISEKYHFATPYHYFDLWLNGFLAKALHLNYSLGLYLITYVFFTLTFLFGVLACIEHFVKVNLYRGIIALLLLFVSGLYVSENVFHLYNYQAQMEGMMERYGGKLLPVYCFTLMFVFLFILKQSKKTALIVLLILPVVSISLAPAVLGGLLTFCIYKLVGKKEDKKYYLRLSLYTLMTLFVIGLFYFLNKKNNLNYRLEKSLFEYSDLNQFSLFRIKYYVVELFLKTYAQPFLFIINYLPFVLVLFYLAIKRSIEPALKELILLFTFIWFCGLLAFSTFYLMDDAYQLYTNALVLWHVLFAFLFITLLFKFNDKSIFKPVVASAFIISLIYNSVVAWHSFNKPDYYDLKFSDKYLKELNQQFKNKGETMLGATFYNERFYKNLLIGYPYEYYCMPFVFSSKMYVPFNLTAIDQVPTSNKYQIEKSVSKSPFNQYLLENSVGSNINDLLYFQIEFIKKYHINYLICPKELTIDFQNYLPVKFEIKDELSGQRFIILK